MRSGSTRALSASPASGASAQPLPASASEAAGGLRLIADRSLYTSWEGASLRSEEADKLHREESLLINPADAEPLGVRSGDELVLANGSNEVRIAAQLDDGVPPGVVYASRYFDGGALMALFPLRRRCGRRRPGAGAGAPARLSPDASMLHASRLPPR